MKLEELQALPEILSGDFKTIDPYLKALDKHLILRTYLAGYSLGEIDTNVWLTLRKNNVSVAFIRKGKLENLTRWFLFIEQIHPEIQADVKAAHAAHQAKVAAASKAGASYNMALQNPEKGIVTRFLPEPS
jgi:glutamyl-tRNA synthetase